MRKLIVGLIIVAVLVGIFVVADRIALSMAEGEIAKRVADEQRLDEDPDVSIGGFPFLTQAFGGSYDDIDLSINSYTDQGVTLKDVTVKLKDVDAPLSDVVGGNADSVVAGTAVASGVVPYDVVDDRAPRGVKVQPQGENLRVSGPITYAGFSRNLTAVVTVQATRRGIQVTPQSVQDGSTGSPIPLGLVQQRFAFLVPVRDLPLGSEISAVEVTKDGLRVAATARNVKISEARKASRS